MNFFNLNGFEKAESFKKYLRDKKIVYTDINETLQFEYQNERGKVNYRNGLISMNGKGAFTLWEMFLRDEIKKSVH